MGNFRKFWFDNCKYYRNMVNDLINKSKKKKDLGH